MIRYCKCCKLINWHLAAVFIFFGLLVKAQEMKISGVVLDTTNNAPLKGALIMAVRLSDSTLLSYTRSVANGEFSLPKTPIDTFEVIIQHPQFADQVFIVVGNEQNTEFNFGKVILPPKSNSINEVVIYGYKDPVYFKGDTIVYVADSFNVKQNANVEDLLKKLPGISVDKDGNIKSRGKEVSQVLVDGDEFFGTDPTMATKNLYAESVESVEVYEKKNEEATAETGSSETITVMDLKLKDDAKKGYFGKTSLGSDFNKFYEGEFLSNRFSKKQKVSVFGLTSNTPKSSFGFADSYKYGIENDNLTISEGEDGSIMQYYGDNAPQGYPTTRKLGFYFNDKPTDKVKVNANYSYKENELKVNNYTYSQYFLTDTSYVTDNAEVNTQSTKTHSFGFKYNYQIDSLTTLEIEPRANLNTTRFDKETTNKFLTANQEETSSTRTFNASNSKSSDFSAKAALNRKFHKVDRLLNIKYSLDYSDKSNTGKLYTNYKFIKPAFADSLIDQEKSGGSLEAVHRGIFTYTEPLTPKIKLSFVYDITAGNAHQQRETFNKINNEYTAKDSLLSNEFDSKRVNNLFSASFIYETKKTRFSIGSKVRNNQAVNENLVTGGTIKQNINNVLPQVSYRYKFSDNRQLSIAYTTNSASPKVSQLQPVPDNSNPNFIRLGNPNLLPTFANNFNLNYYTYSALKNNHMYAGLNATVTNNDFSSSTRFDQFGRTVSTPINVNGNYNISAYVGGRISVKPGLLFFNYGGNVSDYRNINFINDLENKTKSSSLSSDLGLSVEGEKLEASAGIGASINSTVSSLNNLSNKPYGSTRYEVEFSYQFPKGFSLESDVDYTKNSKRANGYNIDYLIWNAALNKKFFKRENFIVGLEAYDMLNQNISTNRSVQANSIIDSRTSVIGRYFLLKATYKFDSKKEKIADDDDEWY